MFCAKTVIVIWIMTVFSKNISLIGEKRHNHDANKINLSHTISKKIFRRDHHIFFAAIVITTIFFRNCHDHDNIFWYLL
ncbi:hypothetical protein EV361DRAFT_587842 [Lentinula raphanica]|nr:hypothetical protein EV361DRAFT_587842 [Lentinula raphanica]